METLLGFLVLVVIVAIWIAGKRRKPDANEARIRVSSHRDPVFEEHMRNYDAYGQVVSKYKRITDSHYALIEKIGVAYTVANNLRSITSSDMDAVIKLCEQDIALAPDYKRFCDEVNATGYFESGNAFTVRSYP